MYCLSKVRANERIPMAMLIPIPIPSTDPTISGAPKVFKHSFPGKHVARAFNRIISGRWVVLKSKGLHLLSPTGTDLACLAFQV